ncbi:heme exporter protein CcmD [Sneathiella chinensis]|uniref:Heme exporter protein D n=1 Tax=Sneathiella chinensis TaxID=349750 RepID=A0ABQ5U9G4_9PROT|nr:heme exporter protein CcmD [Sneathiella chinensis]GLQ07818.1 hypothetical protein GCM10007924_30400 [Sneathiella chinensis]
MAEFNEFLEMGGYAAFVWPSYLVSAVVLTLLVVFSVRRLRRIERDLKPFEERRQARRNRTRSSRTEPLNDT